jgi:hypothetical protein
MNDGRFAGGSRALLDAARQDGPGSAGRSRIWEGVALAPHLSLVASAGRESLKPGAVTAGATAKAGAGVVAALSAGKLLLAGAVVGSALTVGLGAFLLRGPLHSHAVTLAENAQVASADGSRLGNRAPTYAAYAPEVRAVVVPEAAVAAAPVEKGDVPAGVPVKVDAPVARHEASAPSKAVPTSGDSDGLMREGALVSEARRDLALGLSLGALASLDAAARGTSRSLEPEELSLRARALRSLGRNAEASRVEETLKTRYPDNFLAH